MPPPAPAIALAALVLAGTAAPAAAASTAPPLRPCSPPRSARRWIGAELIAYGGWTALLTFVGAFFIERLGVREAAVGWFLAAGATAYFVAIAAPCARDRAGAAPRF